MRVVKKAFAHVGAVIKGMLFIGFTVQILLGLAWMCRNFGQVQNFGEPDSALYKGLFRLLGEIPQLMYLLQLVTAFLAGDYFLGSFSGSLVEEYLRNGRVWLRNKNGGGWLQSRNGRSRLQSRNGRSRLQSRNGRSRLQSRNGRSRLQSRNGRSRLQSRNGMERFWSLWRALALLTYPFAMQCHMAVLPFSFMGSLFLVMLSLMVRLFARGRVPFHGEPAVKAEEAAIPREAEAGETAGRMAAEVEGATIGNPVKRRWQVIAHLALAVVCAGMFTLLSGAADASGREEPGRGIEAAMASRFAWPTIWYDQGSWSDELRAAVEDVLWEASYYPENMALLQSALEERAGAEAVGAYYREIAEVAWRNHAPMIIRQMGWDVLGYMLTPVIFQLQLRGEAYDSYTGRNYEIMRGNAPVLTRNYVNYGCWWFLAAFVLSLLSFLFLPIIKKTAPVKEAVSMKAPAGEQGLPGIGGRRAALTGPVLMCIVCSGILVGLLTLRGAGLMDYKYTALISQLWTLPALFHAHDRGVIGINFGTFEGCEGFGKVPSDNS